VRKKLAISGARENVEHQYRSGWVNQTLVGEKSTSCKHRKPLERGTQEIIKKESWMVMGHKMHTMVLGEELDGHTS
jgi:hypothetical protein